MVLSEKPFKCKIGRSLCSGIGGLGFSEIKATQQWATK